MVTPQDFIHRLKSQKNILYKQYHVKVLLKRFHLNGHTIGFHPQTQKLELPSTAPSFTLGVNELNVSIDHRYLVISPPNYLSTNEIATKNRNQHNIVLNLHEPASYPDVSLSSVRAKEGGKETTGEPSVPFPWSLAVHHQSLVCHAKNEAPEEEAVHERKFLNRYFIFIFQRNDQQL